MTIRCRNLGLQLSGARLLQGVNVEIPVGMIVAVLGPNGAGKTSLLRLMAAELPPSSGDIDLNGRALARWQPDQRARMLGVLPQHSLLDFPFTAQEVVLLGRTPHATGVRRDRQIAMQALTAVDADFLAERNFTRLSGGEKQRVHLARVLAQVWEEVPEGPRFLLLDEPTAAFDLAHQQLTLEIVREFAGRGVGVMMVLHDLNLAARCADQIILLQSGQLVVVGTPAEVLQTQIVRDVFAVDASIGEHPVSGRPLVIT